MEKNRGFTESLLGRRIRIRVFNPFGPSTLQNINVEVSFVSLPAVYLGKCWAMCTDSCVAHMQDKGNKKAESLMALIHPVCLLYKFIAQYFDMRGIF